MSRRGNLWPTQNFTGRYLLYLYISAYLDTYISISKNGFKRRIKSSTGQGFCPTRHSDCTCILLDT
ncbi:unnamed protein product, partial [Allacma fusca]